MTLTQEEKAAAKAEKDAAKAAAKAAQSSDSVVVKDRNGDVIRGYSEEVHGEDFGALAAEFASKEEGRTVEAA